MTHIIKPGEKAPNLSFNTLKDGTWSLHDNLSNEMNIVIFYRGLHCPSLQRVFSIYSKSIR